VELVSADVRDRARERARGRHEPGRPRRWMRADQL